MNSEGPKGGWRKGGRGRKLSHFSFCCAFRCCVVYSPCFPVWGEEKVMTIFDAGPLAAGPLCGLLMDFIAFCRCSTGVALHPLKILVSHLPPPPLRAGRCRTAGPLCGLLMNRVVTNYSGSKILWIRAPHYF